jgi:hypothetical protein
MCSHAYMLVCMCTMRVYVPTHEMYRVPQTTHIHIHTHLDMHSKHHTPQILTLSLASTSAPLSIRSFTTSVCPSHDAYMSGVHPSYMTQRHACATHQHTTSAVSHSSPCTNIQASCRPILQIHSMHTSPSSTLNHILQPHLLSTHTHQPCTTASIKIQTILHYAQPTHTCIHLHPPISHIYPCNPSICAYPFHLHPSSAIHTYTSSSQNTCINTYDPYIPNDVCLHTRISNVCACVHTATSLSNWYQSANTCRYKYLGTHLYMYIHCIYVCMYICKRRTACVYMCMCVFIFIYTHIGIYVNVYMHMNAHIDVHVYVYVYVCIYAYMYIFRKIYIYAQYVFMHYVYVCKCVMHFVYMQIYVCTSINISKTMDTHIYIFMYVGMCK